MKVRIKSKESFYNDPLIRDEYLYRNNDILTHETPFERSVWSSKLPREMHKHFGNICTIKSNHIYGCNVEENTWTWCSRLFEEVNI